MSGLVVDWCLPTTFPVCSGSHGRGTWPMQPPVTPTREGTGSGTVGAGRLPTCLSRGVWGRRDQAFEVTGGCVELVNSAGEVGCHRVCAGIVGAVHGAYL